jgi:hypothetical protein
MIIIIKIRPVDDMTWKAQKLSRQIGATQQALYFWRQQKVINADIIDDPAAQLLILQAKYMDGTIATALESSYNTYSTAVASDRANALIAVQNWCESQYTSAELSRIYRSKDEKTKRTIRRQPTGVTGQSDRDNM